MHNNDENSDNPRSLNEEPVADPTVAEPTVADPTVADPTVADPIVDDQVITTMLRDAGGDAELGIVLAQIRGLGSSPAPAPSAELAALLANGLPSTPRPTRRRSLRHRAFLGTILVAAMGATAVGAAVADDSFRQGAQTAISNLINTLSPFRQSAPAPTQPVGSPRPSPSQKPVNPGTTAPIANSGDGEYRDRIPGQTETGQTETGKSEPSQPETSRTEPSQPETSQPETSRQPEISKPETSKPETSRTEPSQPEPSRPETSKPESASDPVPSTGVEGASTKPPETG